MKKSIIAATFGGVLASGFLILSAPVASAMGPCFGDATSPGGTGMGSQACLDCYHANANNDPAQVCFSGLGAAQPQQQPQIPANTANCSTDNNNITHCSPAQNNPCSYGYASTQNSDFTWTCSPIGSLGVRG